MAALWRDYPATERRQTALPSTLNSPAPSGAPLQVPPSGRNKRTSQAELLLALLRARRGESERLELPEIRNLGIYQHTARIFELRERGFVIENEMERMEDGSVHSFYSLVHDPELDGVQ